MRGGAVVVAVAALSARHTMAYSGGSGGINGGMSCDAIGVCASGTCPEGMTGVGPPTRSTVYSIRTKGDGPYVAGGDPTTYTPGESMSIWITVEAIKIQRKEEKGLLQCFCAPPKKGQINRPGGDRCGRSYRGSTCNEPHWEDAGYRGLLIYAVNDQEVKVGGWDIPRSLPPIFWLPPDSACEGKSVVHADATIKNYQHEIVFTPPPTGTGTITFRALLKQGKTEMGAFYWPTAPASANPTAVPVIMSPSGDLTLTEAAPAPRQMWYRATADDQSCNDVCSANAMVCDEAALGDATRAGVKDSPSAVKNAIKKYYTGAAPMLGECEPFHPSMSATDEKWTFFHRTTNTVANQVCTTPAAPACSAKPSDAPASSDFSPGNIGGTTLNFRRLCPCKASRRRLKGSAANAAKPTANAAKPIANAAESSRVVPYASALTLGALVALGSGSGRAASFPLLLLAASQLLPRAEAHNWLWNPKTRFNNFASMTQPCRAKSSKTPAMVLNPLQDFEVEWATGHAGQPRRFTIVKAEDEKYLSMLNEGLHQDFLDTAPADKYLPSGGKWEKRHLSWSINQDGAMSRNHGACENSKHVNEQKTLVTPLTDPHYIPRAQAFKCSWLGRHDQSPEGGDQCYEVGAHSADPSITGVQQFKYPASMSAMQRVTEHTSTKYPWIVAAHAFTPAPFAKDYANQADVARFPAPSLPGLYVMHWWWRGLTACVDFAVMPTKAGGGADVPDGGRYQIEGILPAWERTTHAHLDLKYTSYEWALRANTLPNGQCSDSNSPPKKRLCFVIPPEDGVNALGETAAQALQACQDRCAVDFATAPGTIGCYGVNVIPIDLPAEVRFRDATTGKPGTNDWDGGVKTTDHNIPWGISNCDRTCLAGEPANSMMCYPQVIHSANMYLIAEVQVIDNDPANAIWYSTSFKKVKQVDFPGVDTRCENFEWPAGSGKMMCPDPASPPRWKFGDRCISCDLMIKNQNVSTVVQRWAVLPKDECKMCSYTAAPIAPAPTPAPTVDQNSFNDGSSWPRNFTTPNNELFIGWKQGGLNSTNTKNVLNALTFLFVCPGCDATGWVALGINHGAHVATPGVAKMVGTRAVIWQMATDTIKEYTITGKSADTIEVFAQGNHIAHVATMPATKRATFALGFGNNPFNHWQIADEHIDLIADQEVMWAYGSGGLSYHRARGIAKFDFSGFAKDTTSAPSPAGAHGPTTYEPTVGPTTYEPTVAPFSLRPTISPSTVAGANGQSAAEGVGDDGAAIAVAVVLTLFGAAVALLIAAGVATVVVVLILTKKKRVKMSLAPENSSEERRDSKLDHSGLELSRINSRVTMTNPLSSTRVGGGDIDSVMAGAVVGKPADQFHANGILSVDNPKFGEAPVVELKGGTEVVAAAPSTSLAKSDANEVLAVLVAVPTAVAAVEESKAGAASDSESAAFKLFRTSMTELDGSDAATAAMLVVQKGKTSTEHSEDFHLPSVEGQEHSDDFQIDLDASHEEEKHEEEDDFDIDLDTSHDGDALAWEVHEHSESGDFHIDLDASHDEETHSDAFSSDEDIQL